MENHIKRLRTQKKLTLMGLADLTGCSYQQIHKLETGGRRLTQDWMYRLAAALECKPEDLIRDSLPSPQKPTNNTLKEKPTSPYVKPTMVNSIEIPLMHIMQKKGKITLVEHKHNYVTLSLSALQAYPPKKCAAIACHNIQLPDSGFSSKDTVIISLNPTKSHDYYLSIKGQTTYIVKEEEIENHRIIGALIWKCERTL